MVIREIFEIFLLIVIVEGCLFPSDYPETPLFVDLGQNITLSCNDNSKDSSSIDVSEVSWRRHGKEIELIGRSHIINGSLAISEVEKNDSGEYCCRLEKNFNSGSDLRMEDEDIVKSKYKLTVRTPPPALVNVSVRPSTVLALLLWDVGDTGGYDILYFSAQFRLKESSFNEPWHDVSRKKIKPFARQIDVYNLSPNSTYTFQIWATNHLGDGEKIQIEGTTENKTEEIELARHLLEGAENFDTRVWVVAVVVVMGTLAMLSAGTCYLLCKECNMPPWDDQEVIELVPNIILNPGFYDADLQAERFYQLDENCNDQTPIRINNNSVIQPIRL